MARRPWYVIDPERLAEIQREVLYRHPRLTFVNTDDKVVLRGSFELREGDVLHDEYEIELELSPETERGIPTTWETAGRIPRTVERHVNPLDGALCVVLPESYWFDNPDGLPLPQFLDGPLRGYLVGQSLVELGEPWPAGEWSHGLGGVLEFYYEVLGTKDPKVALPLVLLLERKEVKGHWPCPCGGGRRLRDCHGPRIYALRDKIPRGLVDAFLRNIRRTVASAV